MTSSPNDFAAEVMATLIKRNTKFCGLHPKCLEILLDGGIKIWFAGDNGTEEQRKAITILNDPVVDNAYIMGDSNVVADICQQIVDAHNVRYS